MTTETPTSERVRSIAEALRTGQTIPWADIVDAVAEEFDLDHEQDMAAIEKLAQRVDQQF